MGKGVMLLHMDVGVTINIPAWVCVNRAYV